MPLDQQHSLINKAYWSLICLAETSQSHAIPVWAPGNANEMATAGGPRWSGLSNRCWGQWHAGWTFRGRNEGIAEDTPHAGWEVRQEIIKVILKNITKTNSKFKKKGCHKLNKLTICIGILWVTSDYVVNRAPNNLFMFVFVVVVDRVGADITVLRQQEVDYDSDVPHQIAEVLIRKVPDDQQVSGTFDNLCCFFWLLLLFFWSWPVFFPHPYLFFLFLPAVLGPASGCPG